MDKNEYVYCTNCKYGAELIKAIINDTDISKQCESCYSYNPEDGVRYKDRPCYEPNYELNRKAIYISGLLSHMREVDDMILTMEHGRVNYNHNLYAERDALKFELNRVEKINGELYVSEMRKGAK